MVLASLREVHAGWAWVVVVGNGLAGSWALAAHRLRAWRTPALWWFTAVAQLAMFVQVGLGVGMVAGQDAEVEQLHMFYGYIALVAIGILYSYRQQLRHRLYLLYGFGGLFVMALGLRSLLTAP